MRVKKKNKLTPLAPVWLQPEAVVGSAVRYIAAFSPKFSRVECVPVGAKSGPSIGQGKCLWEIEVLAPRGKKLGTLRMGGDFQDRPPARELELINRVAKELGEQWPQG